MKLKIAIVVQGRFHAFDLASALLERGHVVTIFTNYPKWAVRRFGFPTEQVQSFWVHGLTTRLATKISQRKLQFYLDEKLHVLFGRRVAAELMKEKWDVVHTWSCVSEEVLKALRGKGALSVLMRGSSHIGVQSQLLEEEERRTGMTQARPQAWAIKREEHEYQLADRISVLSSFARESFLSRGVSPEKLSLLPLGADLTIFRPEPDLIEDRCRRILSNQPLRVLFVGALSFRKGLYDLAEIFRSLGRDGGQGRRFIFRCVGPVTTEAVSLVEELKGLAEFIPSQPQHELGKWYGWADVFVFPTIEDGYAMVLAQAGANSLPILTTTNSAGPDLLIDGKSGWVLPIRSPQAFIERLIWADAHRRELAAMVRDIYRRFKTRAWRDVASDFESLCLEALESRTDRKTLGATGRHTPDDLT